MGGLNGSLMALAAQKTILHRPAIQKVSKLQTRLEEIIGQIARLQQQHDEIQEELHSAQRGLQRGADAVYRQFAEISKPDSGQDGLLEAILYVKAHLEYYSEADVAALRVHIGALLSTANDTPLLYRYQDAWYGGRTSAAPYLYWDGTEWWLQFPMGSLYASTFLDTFMDTELAIAGHTVFVGEERVRSLLDDMRPDERKAKRDELVMALASAGLDTALLQL